MSPEKLQFHKPKSFFLQHSKGQHSHHATARPAPVFEIGDCQLAVWRMGFHGKCALRDLRRTSMSREWARCSFARRAYLLSHALDTHLSKTRECKISSYFSLFCHSRCWSAVKCFFPRWSRHQLVVFSNAAKAFELHKYGFYERLHFVDT